MAAAEAIDARVLTGSIRAEHADSKCAICLDEMNPSNSIELEGCTHTFHTKCVVKWFRLGNSECPLCKYVPSRRQLGYHSKQARIRTNTRFARHKLAPTALKRLVKRLKRARARRKEHLKQFRVWKKSDTGIEYKRLRRIYVNFERKSGIWRNPQIQRLEMDIAVFPVVPLVIL